MTYSIESIKHTRNFILALTKDLSIEQLNEVPSGFNNNIAWNLGHLIAAQQGVCYARAGLNMIVDEKFFNSYKPGSKPVHFINEEELSTIKELFISTIDQLILDYKNNLFANYTPWTTRYGVEMRNIDDAFSFLPFHEGMHTGYIMALKRVIKK